MPRYLVQRVFDDMDDDELTELAARSKRIGKEQFPQITWEHSHVVTDGDGNTISFCVYDAPDPQAIYEHATELGRHQVSNVFEIGGDISPSDFPS